MNYYNEIKNELINNEVYNRVKDYSKNRNDLETYYNVGKLLYDAGSKYGESIIEKFSNKLIIEVGKKYNKRTLFRMRQFYKIFSDEKMSPFATQLSWSHYIELLSLSKEKIIYYIKVSLNYNLSRNELRDRIKNNEYVRLDDDCRYKLINQKRLEVNDLIKNPIIIKNTLIYENVTEKILQRLILEDIPSFLEELGEGFTFIKNEYKIKLGNSYNYIDLLLFNIKYNCFVVVELKVTELKKEHIGQIEVYMNYIDKNIKTVYHDKTIGIIIVKKGNKFILEYSSDKRIFETTYELK